MPPQRKWVTLLTGTILIYTIYCIAGVTQQWIMKQPYLNVSTGTKEYFQNPEIFILAPSFMSWLLGHILTRDNVRKAEIPVKNLVSASLVTTISALAFTQAIYITNYPIVMMFKSCNILSVIFVGLCCSRVKNHKVELDSKKLISGFFITAGILIYNLGGAKQHIEKATNIWGIALLMASLVLDGFLPDLQAEIKVKFDPTPLEMFSDMSKWKSIVILCISVLRGTFMYIVQFFIAHPLSVVHIIIFSVLNSVGQMVVFWMIKEFRQHIVPFIVTTRKIITVIISIVFFKHSFQLAQLMGIAIVIITVVTEFTCEIRRQTQLSKQPLDEPKPSQFQQVNGPQKVHQENQTFTDTQLIEQQPQPKQQPKQQQE